MTFKNGSTVERTKYGGLKVFYKIGGGGVDFGAVTNPAEAYRLALEGRRNAPQAPREPFWPRMARERRKREAKPETKAQRKARLLGEVQPTPEPEPEEDRWGPCPF